MLTFWHEQSLEIQKLKSDQTFLHGKLDHDGQFKSVAERSTSLQADIDARRDEQSTLGKTLKQMKKASKCFSQKITIDSTPKFDTLSK